MTRLNIVLFLTLFATPALAYDWEVDADHLAYSGGGSGTFGMALTAGDLDGDGRDDLVIGEPGWEGGTYWDTGRVVVELTAGDGFQLIGTSMYDHTGTAVEARGDFNGDGDLDLAIGIPDDDGGGTNAGAVWVWYGPVLSLGSPDETVEGTVAGGRFGATLSVVSVNSGWNSELVVGAPNAGSDDGRIYVFDGAYLYARQDADDADIVVSGASGSGEQAGAALDARINENLLVIGAPKADTGSTDSGRICTVELDFGTPAPALDTDFHLRVAGVGTTFFGERIVVTQDPDSPGHTIASARGDGTPTARFYLFKNDSSPLDIDTKLANGWWQTYYPATPAFSTPFPIAAGDFNGDSTVDLVFGDPNRQSGADDDAGRVTLIDDASTWDFDAVGWEIGDASDAGMYTEFWDPTPTTGNGVAFGSALAVGDFNGDGKADFASAAPGDDDGGSDEGRVHLYFGPFRPVEGPVADTSADVTVEGAADYDRIGEVVQDIGDINRDGFRDIAIGAPSARSSQGDVYIFFGPGPGVAFWWGGAPLDPANADIIFEGDGKAGQSIASAGDLDGDGFDDFLIGAPDADNSGGTDNGNVYLF